MKTASHRDGQALNGMEPPAKRTAAAVESLNQPRNTANQNSKQPAAEIAGFLLSGFRPKED